MATGAGTHGNISSGYTIVTGYCFCASNESFDTGIIPTPNSPA
nr:hypothetical protein [Paraclostridium sp. AKS73]